MSRCGMESSLNGGLVRTAMTPLQGSLAILSHSLYAQCERDMRVVGSADLLLSFLSLR